MKKGLCSIEDIERITELLSEISSIMGVGDSGILHTQTCFVGGESMMIGRAAFVDLFDDYVTHGDFSSVSFNGVDVRAIL